MWEIRQLISTFDNAPCSAGRKSKLPPKFWGGGGLRLGAPSAPLNHAIWS